MTAAEVLLVLLALARPSGAYRRCLDARRDTIAEQATAAVEQVARERPDAPRVPVDLLLVVAYLESHLGCAPGSGGCWGAPLSPARRWAAGRPVHAARALASGLRVCHTELGAVSRFRCGLCSCRRVVGYAAPYAMRLLARVRADADTHATDEASQP